MSLSVSDSDSSKMAVVWYLSMYCRTASELGRAVVAPESIKTDGCLAGSFRSYYCVSMAGSPDSVRNTTSVASPSTLKVSAA